MSRIIALAVTTLPLVAAQVAAVAALESEAARGRLLAQYWCAGCHAVRSVDRQSPDPAAPRFADVAVSPTSSELGLRVFLQSEHETMPALRLTREEIDALVAYIVSLKR